MRKHVLTLLLLSFIYSQILTAQCSPGLDYELRFFPTLKFSGVAPQPWAINGQTDDWQTILGPGTGNNQSPYSPPRSSLLNYSFEPGDFDTPDPAADIKFMAFTYDDYNIYFYLRKLNNSSTNFFYFLDLNADGKMSYGEAVLGGRTLPGNSNSTNNVLTLYNYRPVSGYTEDPLGNPYVDGYTMPGSTVKYFDNHQIPSDRTLLPNEIFSIRPTENGYGVEFAIPWRYIGQLPGNIFTYHVALQKAFPPGQQPQTTYQPQLVEDNAGSCCRKLLFSGLPEYNITSTEIVPLGNLSYKIRATLQNLKNTRMAVSINELFFSNIQLNPGLPFSPTDITVSVNGETPPYLLGSITSQPLRYAYYTDFGMPDYRQKVVIDAFSTATAEINFSLPPNHSILQASVGVSFSDGYFINNDPFFLFTDLIYCGGFSGGAPGGSRPVVLEVTTENKNKRSNNVSETNQPGALLKVFPNPSKGNATVVIPGDGLKGELRLENVTGKLIYRKINTTGSTITLQNLKSGFYLLRYTDGGSGKQYIEKLIVQ